MLLICTKIDPTKFKTGIFTEGKAYQAHMVSDGRLVQLFDNYDNTKFVSSDSLIFPLGETDVYAHFEIFNPNKETAK